MRSYHPFPRNLFQQGPQRIHILLRDPSAVAKGHKILCDSAALAQGAGSSRHADFFCGAGNGMTFPRWSSEIHLPLCFRNFSGT
jgi:hypothetical protein